MYNYFMNIIKKHNWTKHWAIDSCILSCTIFSHNFDITIGKAYGVSLDPTAFILRKGYATCLIDKDQYKELGNKLAETVKKDSDIIF